MPGPPAGTDCYSTATSSTDSACADKYCVDGPARRTWYFSRSKPGGQLAVEHTAVDRAQPQIEPRPQDPLPGGHRQLGDAAFGSPEWQAVYHQPSAHKFTFLREQYRATLRQAGFTHTLYFEMIDEGNRKLYLIFGTRHELGLEKMKDAMWKVDPSYGVRYRDPRDTQQQMLELVFEPDTAPLRRILHEFISGSPDGRTIPELKRYALLETVYRPAQVIAAVRQLRDAGAVTTEPRAINAKTQVRPAAAPQTSSPSAEQDALW